MTTAHPAVRQIGERRFLKEDQDWFASASLDCNPMHMDAVVARRLIAGRQVVHGVHILLTALEFWDDAGALPVSISASFTNPVGVEEEVAFTQFSDNPNTIAIDASIDGLPCARVEISLGANDGVENTRSPEPETTVDALLATTAPLDKEPALHVGKRYTLKPNESDFSARFPKACRHLGTRGFAATASLSYFVGMVCPGLHSVLSSLSFSLCPENGENAALTFVVHRYDPRFRIFDIGFSGCIKGRVKAFLRPPPQTQASIGELAASVTSGEFTGNRALIIGGSRGLGELVAKLLASGGGDVIITYAVGRDDAMRVRDEINQCAPGGCQVQRLDLNSDRFDAAAIPWHTIDTVYFFATPRIFRKKAQLFSAPLFREFCGFYIEKFNAMCTHIENMQPAHAVTVYFPSTVAVDDRPEGMAEYAMAKAAAELLVQEINSTFKHVKVVTTRLPRLNTDQTNTIFAVAAQANVETILPLLRSLRDDTR